MRAAMLAMLLCTSAGTAGAQTIEQNRRPIEIFGLTVGGTGLARAREIIADGAARGVFDSVSYYRGLYFNENGDRAWYPRDAGYRNFDDAGYVSCLSGRYNYTRLHSRVPFQVFFYCGAIFKIDAILQDPQLLSSVKAAIEINYGPAAGDGDTCMWRPRGDLPEVVLRMQGGDDPSPVRQRRRYYLETIDGQAPYGPYCNLFGRPCEKAYLKYEKVCRDKALDTFRREREERERNERKDEQKSE